MAYKRLPDNLPTILRSYGLKVVTVPGWKTRGRPVTVGEFNPVGVLCHHTATSVSSSNAAVIRLLVDGRSDLPGPLAQLGLGRDGTVYIIASGRANHAGEAKPSGTVAGGDGNKLYVGIEAFNNGVNEDWPKVQMEAYVLLCAVLCVDITLNSEQTVRAHKETSVTGKIDPHGIVMNPFRDRVDSKIREIRHPKEIEKIMTRGSRVDHALADLRKAHGKDERAKNIHAAVAALKLIKPAQRIVEH